MSQKLYFFPWEEVEIPIKAKPGAPPSKVSVYTNGTATEDNLAVGDLELKPGEPFFKFGPLEGLKFEESPLLVKFAADVSAGEKNVLGKLNDKLDELLEKKEAKGSFALNFGNDTLTITIATEGGGGAGVGDEAGSGAAAAPTGNVKFFTVKPKFPIALILENEETVVICIRFMIRFFYHFCDALNLALDYWKKLPKDRPHDWPTATLGFAWWLNVFSVFAIKDALYDIVNDHAQFVADALQKLGFEFELNARAALSGTVYVHMDASYTVAGKCWVPLATLLAPIIQFLCAGAPKPPAEGAGLADLIEPRIEAKANDHFDLKVGGFPVQLEVESRGVLAQGSFCVPKGSPLRKKIEKIGKDIADAADTYKNSRMKSLPDEMKLPRMLLDLMDAEVRSMLQLMKAASKLVKRAKSTAAGVQGALADGQVNQAELSKGAGEAGEALGEVKEAGDAINKSFQTASPHVSKIMAYLRGERPADEPRGVGPQAEAVIRALRESKVHGIAIEPGSPLQSAVEGDRKKVWIHLDDEEKAKLERACFSPPVPAESVLETVVFRVPLPVRPQVVGWDDYHDPEKKLTVSGIVVGFDIVPDAEAFNARRPAGQVAAGLGSRRWTRDAKFWVWVETGLVSHLSSKKIALPELSLDDSGALLLTFDKLEKGKVTDAEIAPLKGACRQKTTTIWKVTLMTNATTDELREIEEQVDRNQPDDDPYATPGLDNIIASVKGWAEAQGAGGGVPGLTGADGDAAKKRFEALGSALPTHGPRAKK